MKILIKLNMQGSIFKMKYTGYSMLSLSNSVHRREKVYKLQIVDIGAFNESDPTAPDWAAEAGKQPVLPDQLPQGVSTQFCIKIARITDPLRVNTEQYKTFMDQIGEPYHRRVDVL
jgi:hypothetical protein